MGFFFLTCLAIIFSPILLFWSKHLLQWFFDYQIKSSLRKTLSSTVDDKANIIASPGNALLTWLMLAALCGRETRSPTYSHLFSYQFKDGTSLTDFLFKEIESLNKVPAKRSLFKLQASDLEDPIVANNYKLATATKLFSKKERLNHLSRQSIFLNLILLYQTQKINHDKVHDDLNPPSLSFGQRFIAWWFKGKLEIPYSQFNSRGFTKETVLDPLAGQMTDIKPTNEHYSPKDLLNPEVIQSYLTKTLNREIIQKKGPTAHGKQPAGKVIEINFDQAITQEVVVAQTLQLDVEHELATVEETQQSRWIDDSNIQSYEERKGEFNSKGLQYAFRFLWPLQQELEKQNSSLEISQNAMDALQQLDNYITDDNITFDRESLPLGLFIEQTNHKATLKYSSEYRIHQFHTNPTAYLLLDPLAIKGQVTITNVYGTSIEEITTESVISKLPKYAFTTEVQHKIERNLEYFGKDKTIYRNAGNPGSATVYKPRKDPILKALQAIINASSNDHSFIDFFFTMLDIYRTKTVSMYTPWDGLKQINLLDFFAENFLCYLTREDAFHSPEAMEYLQRLADETDRKFFRILADFVTAEWGSGKNSMGNTYTSNFVQTVRRVYYFKQFLDELNISLPEPSREHFKAFSNPQGIMSCLTLIKNQSPNLLPWVTKHVYHLPKNFARAKSLLKQGYSFIHKAMALDSDFIDTRRTPNSLWFPSDVDLKSEPVISYGSYIKRAIFLRYLAHSVREDCIISMIDKLEHKVGPLIKEDEWWDVENLNFHWNDLVDELVKLPKKISQENTKEDDLVIVHNQRAIYLDNDIEQLLKTLRAQLDETSINWELIKIKIQTINALTEKYRSYSPQALREAAKILTKNFDLCEALSLIREMYFRMTYAASNQPIKKGIWIRLEQLAVIILGYEGSKAFQVETSEGKTLIIAWTALLRALSGQTVDVLTHNAAFAEDGASELGKLSRYFNIKVAYQKEAHQSVASDIVILYVDVATAILSDMLHTPRQADIALLDEGDNIVIDIQADTTMQLSSNVKEAESALVEQLEHLIRYQRSENAVTVPLTLEEFNTMANCAWDDTTFNFWLNAVKTATQFKKNEDYVVHTDRKNTTRQAIYIVHHDTTGCLDTLSKWAEGTHTCVAIWEKMQGVQHMTVPGVGEVLKQSDVLTHLGKYKERVLFTGTLGEPNEIAWILQCIQSKQVLQFPRAKRPDPDDYTTWSKRNNQPYYSRAFWFPPIVDKTTNEHQARLVSCIKKVQSLNKSCLVFWNTIAECEHFAAYLRVHGISDTSIQIFDDAQDTASGTLDLSRPDSTVIVEHAKFPRKVTLGTARSGRGVNFRDVDYAFITKPGLPRVIEQKGKRVGRDTDFAIVYELYAQNDLDAYDDNLMKTLNGSYPNFFRCEVITTETRYVEEKLAAVRQSLGRGEKKSCA